MQTAGPRGGSQHAGAFTLAEVLIASVVLAMSVVALSQAIVAGQSQSYEAMVEARAVALAEALAEEVLSKPYLDPQTAVTLGPDADETSRSLFDNCDDYHGLTQEPNEQSDADGELYGSVYQPFTRTVVCEYATEENVDLDGVVNGLRVTVTVTDERGRQWQVARFIRE